MKLLQKSIFTYSNVWLKFRQKRLCGLGVIDVDGTDRLTDRQCRSNIHFAFSECIKIVPEAVVSYLIFLSKLKVFRIIQ